MKDLKSKDSNFLQINQPQKFLKENNIREQDSNDYDDDDSVIVNKDYD